MDNIFRRPPTLAGITVPIASSGPTGLYQRPTWLARYDRSAGCQLSVWHLAVGSPPWPQRPRIQKSNPSTLAGAKTRLLMAKHIQLDQTAPDFTLLDVKGQQVRLSDFKYKRNVLLVFNRGFA